MHRKAFDINPPIFIRAAAELQRGQFLQFVKGSPAASGDFSYVESAEGEGKPKLKKVTAVAYTGAPMRVGFGWPVVLDLAGMTKESTGIPLLKNHDPENIVGHSGADEVEISATKIKLQGQVSGVGEAAQEVSALSANGFPWQMSVGASIDRMEFIDRGETVKVNGRNQSGPLYVARKSVLREVSFVAIGADAGTSGNVAASSISEDSTMNFEAWLQAKGFDPAQLTEAQKTALKAAYDAEVAAAKPPNPAPSSGAASHPSGNASDPAPVTAANPVLDIRAQAAAEFERIASIQKACNGSHGEIQAQAIKEGWTVEKTELAVLRAERPKGPAIHMAQADVGDQVVQAAVCLHGKLANVEKQFDDKTLQAAHTHFRRGIGLQQLLLQAAWSNGYTGREVKVHDGNMREILKAAFSTMSLPGILGNTANKFLLMGFMAVETSWRAISSTRPVNDFKQVTSYRLTGDFEFEPLSPAGEIQHGTTGEDSFTNQARTRGKMYTIDRTAIINDDLGALSVIPQRIGRGGALRLNTEFWTAFLDNSSFFTSARGNYQEGAGTVLGIDSLTAAELLFLDQTDPDSKPLGIMPKILLVPNALNVTATKLSRDLEIRDTTASTKYSTGNPHAGKFEPVRSSYLSNTSLTGYSTTAWYLLASPMDLPTMEVVFLNGVETPVVESAEADFNTLGIQMRGYFDFGCSKQDWRGGVKSKGAA